MNSSFYLAIATLCFAQMACGQQPTRTTTDNTTLVIEGRVINVFQSASANQNVLVQIQVQKSEAMRLDNLERSTRFPAPGEYLYVHVDSSISSTNRGNRETSQLPRPDTYIRAMLQSGNHQDWAGVSQDWYQEIGRDSGPVTTNDSRSILGITTERVSLTKFHALKVTAVEAESPAAKAGIEVGDILLSANDVDLSRPEQLVEQVQKSDGLLKLMVQDVRAGRVVPVEVKWDSAMKASGQVRSLGVTTQVAFIDGKAALKVVTVADGSPAQQAGIEPGLIILTADGSPLPKPENLAFAERQAKGILVLLVVEPRTRVERTVRADLR